MDEVVEERREDNVDEPLLVRKLKSAQFFGLPTSITLGFSCSTGFFLVFERDEEIDSDDDLEDREELDE